MSKELKFDFNYEVLPDNTNNYDLTFKLIIIGDCGVGKSCLTQQASKNLFDDSYCSTVGFEFLVFNIRIDDKIIKLQLWDTCGQELYRSLVASFYRSASLAIMVYSVTNKKSFQNIDLWYKDLKNNASPDINVFLIGNKIDLTDQREVTTKEGETFKDEFRLDKFVECSAKTGFNAKNIFIEAAKLLYDKYMKYQKEKEIQDIYGAKSKCQTKSYDDPINAYDCDTGTISRKKFAKRKKCC